MKAVALLRVGGGRGAWVRVRFALTTLVMTGIAMSACAGCGNSDTAATRRSSNQAVASGAGSNVAGARQSARKFIKDTDGDYDSYVKSRYDEDDKNVLDYGQPADTADRQAISTVVKRYYAAAAAANGAVACSLVYWVVAETIPEEYGPRGKPCAVALAKLFERMHRHFLADIASLKVTGARVEGNRGLALLSFDTQPDRHILLHREGRAWRIYELLDNGLG